MITPNTSSLLSGSSTPRGVMITPNTPIRGVMITPNTSSLLSGRLVRLRSNVLYSRAGGIVAAMSVAALNVDVAAAIVETSTCIVISTVSIVSIEGGE
jgi:hypothetical protein